MRLEIEKQYSEYHFKEQELMSKLRDVSSRLSLKAVSRYSKLAEETKVGGLKKAGKSVNSIIQTSAEKSGEANPFLSNESKSSQQPGNSPR